MRKVKRTAGLVVTTVLTAAMAVSIIGGCSNGKGENKPPTNSNVSNKETPHETEKPLEIGWLAYNSSAQPDKDSPIIKLMEEKYKTKFDIWYVDNTKWDDSLNIKLAAGEMPDFMKVLNRNNIPNYVDQNILAPIPEEMLTQFAPTFKKFFDDHFPEIWNSVKYDGKIYGIPGANLNAAYPTVVIWRKDWLENVGITKTPETLEEFEDALRKFRNNDPDDNGKKDTYGLSDFAIPGIMGAFGYPGLMELKSAAKGELDKAICYILKDGEIKIAAIQPEMKEALTLLSKWYKEGLIDPEFITSENTGGYWGDSQAFYNGKIGLTGKGMFYQWRNTLDPDNPSYLGGNQYLNFKKSQPNGEIVFGKPMIGPDGKSGTPQWDTAVSPASFTTKSLRDPRIMETVLRMVEDQTTDYDLFQTNRFGIKGVGWTEEDGKFKQLVVEPSNIKSEQAGKNVLTIGGNKEFALRSQGPAGDFAFAEQVNKYPGYKPLIVPPVEAYNKYGADLAKLTVEYYFKIITGERPVSDFDEFVQKFREHGGEQLEKEATEAYNKMIGE